MRLVIISCGNAKIWKRVPDAGPTQARDAYVSPYFKDNRRYAEKFSDVWLILSAKYGFIEPSFVIPAAYEVTFKRPSTRPISTAALATQVHEGQLTKYERAEVLGGSDYAERVRAAFAGSSVRIACPIAGLRLREGWHRVKRALLSNEPLTR